MGKRVSIFSATGQSAESLNSRTLTNPIFLILFESLQDIVELDHPTSPTKAKVYQLKMKDTGEWTWKSLTALPQTARKKKNSNETTAPLPFEKSPIGKLALALSELTSLEQEGTFVSNLGCDAKLEKGSTAGTLRICRFSELAQELRDQIAPELTKLKCPVPLQSLSLHKTELSLEDPDTHVTGKVNNYLSKNAPQHTGQSQSFAESLFATLSKRSRRTDPPTCFAELVATRGYTKTEFVNAVDALCATPDQQQIVNNWLGHLLNEKMPPVEHTKLQIKLIQILQRRLQIGGDDVTPLSEAAKDWALANPPNESILEFVRNGAAVLSQKFPGTAKEDLQAQLILEGIKCLCQT